MNKDLILITCPVCGQQYLPSEIFFPDDLLGKPTEIVKDDSGRVEFFLGDEPNLTEDYVCDNCGSRLKINANISYKVDLVPNEFEEEYVTTFKRPKKLKLEESSLFD
jgi:DNA-directed RNA polymerase subunit RPC12/RpoP